MAKSSRHCRLVWAAFALMLSLASCGPFQVGIEQAPASSNATAATPGVDRTAPASPIPDDADARVVALETANARLAAQVATLTAARASLATATQLAPPSASPSPAADTVAPSATPAAPPTRITFSTGSASATVTPDLSGGAARGYVLKVLAGQHLILSADRAVSVQVNGPDGRALAPVATRPQQWEYVVGQTGDHIIVLTGEGRTTLTIYVPPR